MRPLLLALAVLAGTACGGDDDPDVDVATCDAVERVYNVAADAWRAQYGDGDPTEDDLDEFITDPGETRDLVDIVDGDVVLVGDCA